MRLAPALFLCLALWGQGPPAAAPTADAKGPPPAAAGQPPSAAESLRAAMAAQQEAVKRQAAAVGARLVPWAPPRRGQEPVCDAVPETTLAPLLAEATKANGLQDGLLHAVIEQESAFRPCAISAKGAQGLMQLMPETAARFAVKDPFDTRQNVEAGAKYLKDLLEKYKGELKQALGAYNAGPGAADAAGGVPDIAETKDYVEAILKKLGK